MLHRGSDPSKPWTRGLLKYLQNHRADFMCIKKNLPPLDLSRVNPLLSSMVICSARSDKLLSNPRFPLNVSDNRRFSFFRFIIFVRCWIPFCHRRGTGCTTTGYPALAPWNKNKQNHNYFMHPGISINKNQNYSMHPGISIYKIKITSCTLK